jgi:hypothetical protein
VSALASDLPGLFPEDVIQAGVVRELAGFHDPGVKGLLPAVRSGGGVRVEKVFAVTREADDVMRTVTIRDRRLRHESCLAEATPVSMKPVAAMLVRLEVAGIDDSKRTDCRECAGFRSVNRVCPASELDAVTLVASRQGQALCE